MKASQMTLDERATQAEALYERKIRQVVETEENIGKFVIIDLDTEDFEVDPVGIESARHLQARNPEAVLFGKRIGYDVSEALGGVMERTAPW